MIRALLETIRSLFWRPPALQVAALCYRISSDGPEVLLVKSLDRGRWIIPKGWPMGGKSLAEAAETEAWEEAGVKGRLNPESIGTFPYVKRQRGGLKRPCSARVFEIEVTTLADVFPETGLRRRIWLSPAQAAGKVDEPELQAILRAFAERHQNSAL
jgi:8-oxo-dGTP pyrophosphatase MutT (NUDIX family)